MSKDKQSVSDNDIKDYVDEIVNNYENISNTENSRTMKKKKITINAPIHSIGQLCLAENYRSNNRNYVICKIESIKNAWTKDGLPGEFVYELLRLNSEDPNDIMRQKRYGTPREGRAMRLTVRESQIVESGFIPQVAQLN